MTKDKATMKKQLVVTIEARFDIPKDVEGLGCIDEALQTLQGYGAAEITDMDIRRVPVENR